MRHLRVWRPPLHVPPYTHPYTLLLLPDWLTGPTRTVKGATWSSCSVQPHSLSTTRSVGGPQTDTTYTQLTLPTTLSCVCSVLNSDHRCSSCFKRGARYCCLLVLPASVCLRERCHYLSTPFPRPPPFLVLSLADTTFRSAEDGRCLLDNDPHSLRLSCSPLPVHSGRGEATVEVTERARTASPSVSE